MPAAASTIEQPGGQSAPDGRPGYSTLKKAVDYCNDEDHVMIDRARGRIGQQRSPPLHHRPRDERRRPRQRAGNILKDHGACLKGDGTGCPHALAWVFWSHEDGEMHRIG